MAQSVADTIQKLQIVIGTLMAGLAMFFTVVLFVGPVSQQSDSSLADMLLLALVALAVGCGAAYFALHRRLMSDIARRAPELRQAADPTALALEPYRRFVVAGGGLIDGPACFGIAVYLISGGVAGLGAAVLGVILLLAHMPSVAKLRHLAEQAARL
jgi:hypothetical protein